MGTCRMGHSREQFAYRVNFSNGKIWQCRECDRIRKTYKGPYQPDQVAIDRAVSGDRDGWLHLKERREAIEQLNQMGYSAAQIAARVGCSDRTVRRARRRKETP